ncbi:MAG TPA: hypothetical protein VLL52_10790 [Anaerolineae bacterium]|nr:hypothetical protein [Anaerolineae bacterium]
MDILPIWSPDGRHIAFVSPYSNERLEIHIINANGTHLQQLTADPTNLQNGLFTIDNYPSWQPMSVR